MATIIPEAVAAPAPPARVNVLGVGVSAITMAQAISTVDGWIAERVRHYVCITGVHGVMECYRDAALRAIHNAAGLVTPDGMPLVFLSRLRGHHHVERVYGPDLMAALCQHSVTRGHRHYLYGGHPDVNRHLAERLARRFPGLQLVGAYAPPFRPLDAEEDAQVVRTINAARPDIIWVGLSTPKQERWMAAHRDRLDAPVMIGVGAAFDFLAGAKRQAPRWVQRSGFEWLFRLATEPRRLWRRYLTNNPLFVGLVLAQLLGLKRFAPAGE